jgi:hypothetical protein
MVTTILFKFMNGMLFAEFGQNPILETSMNIEALKSNPLYAQAFARQVQMPREEEPKTQETAQTVPNMAPRPSAGADFVQKMKGTNEAAGYIATASKGIEALKIAAQNSDADTIMQTAKNISFSGKGVLEPQVFDTSAGIVTVDLRLGLDKLDLRSAEGKEELVKNIDAAKEMLVETKKILSSPVNRGQKEQEAKLNSMDTNSGSDFLKKLGGLIDRADKGLDAFEAGSNKLGNQIF